MPISLSVYNNGGKIMKKLILMSIFLLNITNAFAVYFIEAKGGLAFVDKFDVGATSYSGSLSYILSGEILYEASKSTEVGIGFAYKANSAAKGALYSNDPNASMHLFDSFPVYGVAKYHFPEIKGVSPYAKAFLGVGFNTVGRYDWVVKSSDGLYTGFGLGGEYGNIVGDFSYCMTQSELTFYNENTLSYEIRDTKHSSFNITIGYKYELPWFK